MIVYYNISSVPMTFYFCLIVSIMIIIVFSLGNKNSTISIGTIIGIVIAANVFFGFIVLSVIVVPIIIWYKRCRTSRSK